MIAAQVQGGVQTLLSQGTLEIFAGATAGSIVARVSLESHCMMTHALHLHAPTFSMRTSSLWLFTGGRCLLGAGHLYALPAL